MTMVNLQTFEARREEAIRLGLWIFLGTVTMLFAAFTSAYIVRQSSSDWQAVTLPRMLWVNTVMLVASSAMLELAHASGLRRRWVPAGTLFAAALALGVGFLAGQVIAWRQLAAAGVSLSSGPYGSFFFMMTGAHALHLGAALVVLAWAAGLTWAGLGVRDQRRWEAAVGRCRTFWHFLLGVWIYVLALVALH